MKRIGTYVICFILSLTFGCSPDDAKDPAPEVIVSSPFYFDGEIDGQRVVMQDGKDHFLIETGSGCTSVSGCGCCTSNQHSGLGTGEEFVDSNGAVELEFIHLWFHETFDYEPEGPDIDRMFRKGIYPYDESDGVVIRYLDADGQLWGSDAGENADALLEVVNVLDEVTDYENSSVQLHKIIEVRLSCTLYPINSNLTLPKPKDKMELKKGKMRIRASRH